VRHLLSSNLAKSKKPKFFKDLPLKIAGQIKIYEVNLL